MTRIDSPIRVRFAPSPTGNLHIGTSRTALFNWLFAGRYHGRFILRIEDTDRTRSTVEYEASIIGSLEWLGINWDEGPDIGGEFGPYRQSERINTYKYYAKRLLKNGGAYYCFCTPEELEREKEKALSEGRMPLYSGKCRSLGDHEREAKRLSGLKSVLRFDVHREKREFEIKFKDLIKGKISLSSMVIGDFIIIKADGTPTYNFAAAVDDLAMKISHVLRGEDHITNTARQIMIFDALEAGHPIYGHFSMILGTDRSKLSKRHGATAIDEYRRMGYLSEAIVNYLALLSWSSEDETEIFGLAELVNGFSIDRVSKSPAIFDQPRLDWFNGQWIRRLSTESLTDSITPYLEKAGMKGEPKKLAKVAEAIRTNLTLLSEAPEYAKIFFGDIELTDEAASSLKAASSERVLALLLEKIKPVKKLDAEFAKTLLKEMTAELKEEGIKGRSLYHPIRLALTGLDSGPELFFVIDGLGKEKTTTRLEKALSSN